MGEIPNPRNDRYLPALPPPRPDKYQPVGWNQEFYDPGAGSVGSVESEVGAPPSVPGGDRGGGTHGGWVSVATPTLWLFAANLKLLEDPVRDCLKRLTTVDTHSGGFHDGFLVDDKARRLAEEATTLLDFVLEGLVDTQTVVHRISSRYERTEDLSTMKATELADIMDEFDGDIAATKGLGGFKAGGGTTGGGSAGGPS